ncbi:PACE efflux transporter [Devosia sp.]|uniref:PACE efflux transporter n=1 Tax=Devosia sp. TaxID=1871048 RepID=UPI00273343D5|nr:PACE efflux transporter [Devosia sp.]MDP2779458.1 PACE efflux transporter [Devosia sp.]
MRTARDRIRHTVLFEIFGLLLVTPLGALAFAMPLQDIGVIGVGGATLAMLWNYIYNYGFDRLMQRWRGTTLKTLPLRVLHAILFELGLLLALLPLIAWYLGITLWQALVMDIAFALFYMVYAFVFNLAYDRVYPIPAPNPA